MPAWFYSLVGQITPSSSWAAQVTWLLDGPWLSFQSLLAPSSQPKAVSQKSSYPQKMAGFCSLIPRACDVIPIQGPAKHCKQLPSLPLALQAASDLWNQMVQVGEQSAKQPGPVTEPSLLLGPTQNWQLYGSLGKQVRVTHPDEEYVAWKIQRGPAGVVLLFGCRRGKSNILFFTFERIFWYVPHPWTLEILLRYKTPEFLSVLSSIL